jgi:hypothetical protein
MKTIFMTIYDGAITKNLLRTDFWKVLKEKKDLRFVFFVTPDKVDYYKEHFGGENVFVEVLPRDEFNRNLIYRILTDVLLNSIPTNTVKIREYNRFYLRRGPILKRLSLFIIRRILWYLSKLSLWRRLLRYIYKFFASKSFTPYFEKYRPDLVFAPNMIATEDMQVIGEAKKRGVKTLGMIKSWDSITSKVFIMFKPDKLIVYSPLLKQELIKYSDFPLENILISGIPQFDAYRDKDIIVPREEFLGKLGLDPKKKTIMFCASGDIYAPYDMEILDILNNFIKSGQFAVPVNVLIRPHPKYDAYDALIAQKYPEFIVDRPGKYVHKTSLGSWEFENRDIVHLANSLKHADIVINTSSTMGLESCIFNTPVINIAFDGYHIVPYWLSTRRFCDYNHVDYLLKTGGMRNAKSKEEFLTYINDYLKNPGLDEEGRKRMVREQLHFTDGKSGERIANYLLEMFYEKQH